MDTWFHNNKAPYPMPRSKSHADKPHPGMDEHFFRKPFNDITATLHAHHSPAIPILFKVASLLPMQHIYTVDPKSKYLLIKR